MTTLFHSTVESLRARGVSIPDDVDRALQLITANAEVRKTNDGASLVDGAYASGELTPANLLGKLTELSVLQRFPIELGLNGSRETLCVVEWEDDLGEHGSPPTTVRTV
jgi:hypothetical protein